MSINVLYLPQNFYTAPKHISGYASGPGRGLTQYQRVMDRQTDIMTIPSIELTTASNAAGSHTVKIKLININEKLHKTVQS